MIAGWMVRKPPEVTPGPTKRERLVGRMLLMVGAFAPLLWALFTLVAWYQAGPVLPPSALTVSAGAALLAFGVLLWVVFASRRRQVGPMHAT